MKTQRLTKQEKKESKQMRDIRKNGKRTIWNSKEG